MSTFKSRGPAVIDIRTMLEDTILITINSGRGEGFSASFDTADAPAIALAVLEAAGVETPPFEEMTNIHHARALLAEHVGIERNKAAAAAEEAARGKRRDELAGEVGNDSYDRLGYVSQKLVDQIIDTENELAKERAK